MDIAYYVNSAESRVARLPAAMEFARRNRPGNPSPPLASYPSNPSYPYSSYYDNTYYPNRQQHQGRNRNTPFRMERERELEGVESECRHGQESEETMTGSVMKTVPHAGASLDGSPHTTTRTIDQIPTPNPTTTTSPPLGALDDQYTLSSNPPNPKNSFRYGDWICRVNGCSAHNFGRNVVCIGCGYPKAKSQLPNTNITPSTSASSNIPSFTPTAAMNDIMSLDEKENLVGETIAITNPNSGLNTSSNASIQRQQALARLQRLSITPPSSSSHPTTSSPSAAHSLSLSPSFLPTHSPRFQTQTQGNASLSPLYASQFNLNSASNYNANGLGLGGKRVSPLPSPLPSPSPSASALTSTFGAARQGGVGGGQYLSPLPALPLGLPPSSPSHSLHLHNHHHQQQQRLPSSHPTSPLPYSAPSYTSSSTSSTSASTTTTPLLTPSGRAFARGGRVQNVSRNPLVPCVIWWPDNEEWPLEGQIRPPLNLHHAPPTNTTQSNDVNGGVAPLAGNLPPILNTGNKGPIVNQPGDWICGVCGYLNWRRRKVCQVCLPYAEGNGDSISAAVQAERMALLTEVLMNAKNQIELDSQGSQRVGHSLSQQPQLQQGYSRSSQFEQGGQQRQHSLPLPHQLQVQPNQQQYQREGQSMSQPTSPLPFANSNSYAQFQATSNAGLGLGLGSNVSPSFALSTKHQQQQQMGGAGVGVIGGGFASANRTLPNGSGIASATSALLAPIYQTSPPRQREKADIEGDADGEDMLLPSFLQTLVRSPASSSSPCLSSPPSSSHSHSSPSSSASTSPSPNADDHEGTLSSTPTTPYTHSFGYSHPSLHGYPYAYSSPSPSSTSHSNSHSTFVSPMSSKPTSVGSSPDLGCHSQAEKLTLVGAGGSGVGVIGRGRVRNPSAESTSTSSSSISESEESEGFSSNASVVSSASSATTTTSNSHSHPHSHSNGNGKSKSHSPSPLRNTNSSTTNTSMGVSGGSIWQISAEENLNLGPLGGVGGSFGGMGIASASGSRVGSRKSSFERLQAQLSGMSISGGV